MSKNTIKAAFAAVKSEYESGPIDVNTFSAFVGAQKESALAALEELQNNLDSAMACAPTDEALRAVEAFSFRTASGLMSKEACAAESNRLAGRYGENYSVYMALHDMAARAGACNLPKHNMAIQEERLKAVEGIIDIFFDASDIINRGGVSAERAAEFDAAIDQNTPEE